MIFRYISRKFTIATDLEMKNNFELGNDFKFNIKVEDLAVTPEILNALNFISMYAESYRNKTRMGNPLIAAAFGYTEPPATNNEAVNFFKFYLDAFLNKKPELKPTHMLHVMVTDKDIQRKLIEYFKESIPEFEAAKVS